MVPTLSTERLVLREITKKDSQGIFSCFSHDGITQYYGQDTLRRIEEAEAFVDSFATSYKEKRGIRWGIEVEGEQQIIGTIGYHAWSEKHKRAEVGYEIHPKQWRKGYASEALDKVLQYGFNELSLRRIGAVVFKENIPSQQLLTKFGFVKEGVLRDYMYQNGEAYDTYVYSLLKQSEGRAKTNF
ncbi:N-acetyltransferase [Pontibacillus halophilus JSM 076056 = DSM 19796]|uniref:N-acetyltransferase n=1 Tax=Pontibacillus halophilus JSM 076056 = DSM 19796 TaxID=1385510 RepID=A0A0A5GM56_9BACI|nr:GNAT family protein [Pontibacillus halophilus]KGX92318.1 N-acetyltransferase [Pontibacillus halophilus JSM 076056 = DSM 19796]